MPEGLTDTLTRAELLDLVRFLSELGKGERWSVGRARVARRWDVLQPTKPAYDAWYARGVGALAANPAALSWEPTYSTVAGTLPVEGLARLRPKDLPSVALIQTRIEATTASKVRLKVEGTKGLSAWLDGEIVVLDETMALDLKPGVHTLTLSIATDERKQGIRVEIEDGAGSAAVRFVGGK